MKRTRILVALMLLITTVTTLGVGVTVLAEAPVVRMVVPGISEQTTMDPISGITTLGLGEFEKFLNEKIEGATIKLISIPWDGWIQKIEAMSKAGEMDVGFFTNQVAVPDWYMDLTPFLEADADVNFETIHDLYVEPAVHYMTYKSFNYPEATGKVFGLPMTMACNFMLYDRQIFQDWGIEEPQEGITFTELVDLAEKMNGTNPVTGRKNYGSFLRSYWLEWFAVSYDAVKSLQSDDMLLSNLDMDKYVNYIKESPEVLNFFSDIARLVAVAPDGITTDSGDEKFLTEDNDIAINFDVNNSSNFLKYVYANQTDITDRFVPLLVPTSSTGHQGFPEFFRFSINKTASDPSIAWNVIKQLTTNKEVIDFYLTNYAVDKIIALKDSTGIKMMNAELNQKRLEHQMKEVFITDDYWTWRVPLQAVNSQVLAKQVTPEEARVMFYEGVTAWVENTKAQLQQ